MSIDRTPYFKALREKLDKSRWVQCGKKDHERVFVRDGYEVRCIEDINDPGHFEVSVKGANGLRLKPRMSFRDDQLCESIEAHAKRCRMAQMMEIDETDWPKPDVHVTPDEFAKRVDEHVRAQGIVPIQTVDPDSKVREKYAQRFGELPTGGFKPDQIKDGMAEFFRQFLNPKAVEPEVDIAGAAELEQEAPSEAPSLGKARKREVSK